MTLHRRYLGIYLNDHLAGAASGIALARRCRRSNADQPLGDMLAVFTEELRLDKRLLESVMSAHGIARSRVKQVGAVVAERVGRLKFNGRVFGYSPLSKLVELEGLRVGVLAKRAMWEALLSVEEAAPEPSAVEGALARADSQLERLEQARRDAAVQAFQPRERQRT